MAPQRTGRQAWLALIVTTAWPARLPPIDLTPPAAAYAGAPSITLAAIHADPLASRVHGWVRATLSASSAPYFRFSSCHSSPSRTASLPYSPLRGGTEADPCERPSRLQSSDGRPRSGVHARLALSLWWCCRRVIPPGCSIDVALGPRGRAMQIGLPKCP